MAERQRPATNWFEEAPVYEGEGKLFVCEPVATIEGRVRVAIGRTGRYQCSLLPERAEGITPLGLLTHSLAQGLSSEFSNRGPYDRLEVNCPQGRLVIRTPRLAKFRIPSSSGAEPEENGNDGPHDEPSFLLHVQDMEFLAGLDETPTYWVAPLWNLVTAFRPFPKWLPDHPLRFVKRMPTPSGLREEHRDLFELMEDSKSLLIPFEMKSMAGYIEPVPDCDDLLDGLEEGALPRAITAVMVGSMEGLPKESAEFLKAIPLMAYRLLSLGTGVETSPAYFEWRAADGRLIRRLHAPFSLPVYEKGEETIPDGGALGWLISGAMRSKAGTEHADDISMASRCAFRSLSGTVHIEDSYALLFRAFEALFKVQNIESACLSDQLPPAITKEIHSLLDGASEQIRALAHDMENSDLSQKDALCGVADRVRRTPLGKENRYSLKFFQLLEAHQMPDAAISDKHFHKLINGRVVKWGDWINLLRNAIVHDRGLDFSSGNYSPEEAIRTLFHLQDILVRVIFKMVDYKGEYSPTVIRARAAEPLNWPNENNLPRYVWGSTENHEES